MPNHNQLVFTTSPEQPVTLTNAGPGVLTIKGISITGAFKQTNNCPNSLNPGDECTINVKFHPKTKGVLNGSVNVTDNAPGSPQTVSLTGTGTFVQLLPTTLHMGKHQSDYDPDNPFWGEAYMVTRILPHWIPAYHQAALEVDSRDMPNRIAEARQAIARRPREL